MSQMHRIPGKMRAHRKLLSLVILAAILSGCSVPDTERSTPAGPMLRFSAIPGEGKTELKAKFDPVAKYLAEQLGIRCQYVPVENYQASVEMFKNGDIQLAWFGGLTGVQARAAVPGATAIAQGKEDLSYYSYFIANKRTGLKPSETFPTAIAGYAFTFGSESSTSGRLMPEFFIRENTGKTIDEFFANPPAFSGSHPNTVAAVNDGTAIKCGVLSYVTFDRMQAQGKTKDCVIIWKTPTYQDYNMTAHPDLNTMFGAEFIPKLQEVLIGITDEQLLSAFQRKTLVRANNEDFSALAEIAKSLGKLRN